jgi:hypothetical protein
MIELKFVEEGRIQASPNFSLVSTKSQFLLEWNNFEFRVFEGVDLVMYREGKKSNFVFPLGLIKKICITTHEMTMKDLGKFLLRRVLCFGGQK